MQATGQVESMPMPTLILGRYRLVEQIAAGGIARVWRAHDVQLDRPVAVKLLHPHLLPDETARRRLAAEARAVATLSHAGIATVYDVTTADDPPALVMEMVDGEPLSVRLTRDGPMRPEVAAGLAAEVAEALYHAHQRGIIHRDVKPANILIEAGSGRARLVDFGIAYSLELAAQPLTQTGTTLGTPRYMAPEQLAGEPIGPRTDLWGLGAVLYEALSGTPPFSGTTPLAIARQQADGPPFLPEVDPALAALVSGCLSVEIGVRPLHAGAVAAALRAWLKGDSAPALAMAPTDASTAPAAETQVVPIEPPAAGHQARIAGTRHPAMRRTSPLAVAAAAVAVLLAVVVGLGMALNDDVPLAGGAATPTAQPTPLPTPNWRAPLLAAYLEACGEPLERSELRGLSQAEAEALVDERVQECLDEDGGGKGKGKGNGGNGGNDGNGGGHGEG
jgi:hypothetical protein